MKIKDKYFFLISAFLVIVIVALLIVLINLNKKEDNYELILYKETELTLSKGERFIEPGFYASHNDEVTTSDVDVSYNIDSSVPGDYEITYKYKDIVKTRIIHVVDDTIKIPERKDLIIKLIGDSEIIIEQDDVYEELYAEAYYNDDDISNQIILEGDVDTSQVGIYEINYSINYNGLEKMVTRTVKVVEGLKIDISYDNEYTNESILLDINISGDKFLYVKMPDETISKEKENKYEIKENGTYTFTAYDINNKYITKIISVTNIDKELPTGTCNVKYQDGKTIINVDAKDDIGISYYLYNDNDKSEENTYIYDSEIEDPKVSVFDKALNKTELTCTGDSLKYNFIEMHFIAGVSDDDAILIRTKDKVIMIDGGRYSAKDKVVSYLKGLGIKKIDYMIGSHVHWNHVQAQAAILDNFEVSKVAYSVNIFDCLKLKHCKGSGSKQDNKYIADKLKSKKITPEIWKVGTYIEIGEMKLYNIGPLRGKLTTYENANSLVFILEYKGKKFMFTGDTPSSYMKADTIRNNASRFPNLSLDIDVFKWPHHGYEKMTDALFKMIKPEYAIIPNCCYCSSKYPSSSDKKLMKNYNTKYYQVCDSKNIVLISDGKTIDIKTNQSASTYKR